MATHNNNTSIQSPSQMKGLSKYLALSLHRTIARGIWAFCELGIADLMVDHQAPITASKLSRLNDNNWNAELLYRLLRVVADADIVKRLNTDDEHMHEGSHSEETVRFQLTEDGLILTSNHFSKARDMIRWDLGPQSHLASTYIPSVIKFGYKNGNSFQQAFGCDFFEYMKKEENKQSATIFNNSLVTYTHGAASAIVPVIDCTSFKILADIAGGLGTLLSSILKTNPHLHGILFDIAHVIENAKTINPNEFERKQIEPDRYEFVVGDMFKSETIPLADAYVLKYTIHDWNDEKSIEILKAIRNANKIQTKKTITLFIIEMILLPDGKDNLSAHAMDLDMLSVLSAKERTVDEYVNLLNTSGYDMKQFYRTTGHMSIIEAVTTVHGADE